jgi:hypothetical protein
VATLHAVSALIDSVERLITPVRRTPREIMKKVILIIFLFNSYAVIAQTGSGKDSIAFLDSIFNEIDDILDEMIPHKNYFNAGIGVGTGFFNFRNFTNEDFEREKKLMISPVLSFYHKSGLGISAAGYAITEKKLNFYQASVTPSYDYIKRGRFSTGVAYTRFFTKDDLSFYTTPISNELSAYFSYKKLIIKPAVSIAYGWGSRTQYEKHKSDVMMLRRSRNPRVITVASEESVKDLSTLFSVRKDFDFLDVLFARDLFTITPVVALSAGTQNFGLNTSFSSTSKRMNNFLPGNQFISSKNSFDTQSASLILRADYSVKKYYLQTQFLLDYYLHSTPDRLNNAFAVIAGVIF